MESLRAERDCSTVVRWWEGGGSAGTADGRRGEKMRRFGHSQAGEDSAVGGRGSRR